MHTMTFHIYRAASVPAGSTIESGMRHIFNNGEMVYEACGIADAIGYINAKGFANSIVKFNSAQGHMTMEAKMFLPWASRLAKLINA